MYTSLFHPAFAGGTPRKLNASHRPNRPSLFRRIALPLLAAISLPGALLHAQTISTWNGGTGAWGTGTNWTPTGVPNTNLYDVFIDGGKVGASSVTLGNDLTVGRITIDTGDSLALGSNVFLTIQGGGFAGSGAVVVNGSMALNSPSLLRFGETGSQNFTLSGSGTLDLAGGSITSMASGNTLQNSLAIAGSGSIGGNLLNIVHSGTITAQGAAGISLQPLATFTNAGTITAAAGSKVEFNSGTYTNTGHTMVATGAGAQLYFTSGTTTVTGGALRGVSGGEVYLQSDNLVLDGSGSEAVTLEGATRMAVNYSPTFKGTITNNGTITGESTSRFRVGTASGQTVVLNGSGSLVLNAASISSAFTGNVLDSSIPISGSGQIGQNIADIINRSTITATGTMTLDPAATFTNLGTVTASSAIIEVQDGTYTNTGHVMAATGAGAQLHITGTTTVTGGTLRGLSGGEVYLHSDNLVLDGSGSEAVTLEGATRMAVNYYPVFKGTITNNGTITGESTSRFRVGTASGQTVVLNGTGSLVLNAASISSAFTGNVLDSSIPISGSGQIGQNIADIINRSTITATGTMTLDPAATFTNLGTVTASSATIEVQDGTFTNTGHVMAATGAGAQLHITGATTVTGGTLRGESGGEVYLHSDNVVLDGSGSEAVTLEGATRMAANYYATFKGTLVNNGTMTAENTSRFNVGTANGQTTTIRSSNYTGTLVLNNALIYSNYTGTTLLNGDGHTIRGTGTIGSGALNIQNVGTIGGGAGALTLSPASTLINDTYFGSPGEVLASGGGNVNVTSGAVTNNGRFKADTSGTLSLTGSAALTNYSGGTLTGGSYEVIGGGVMDLGIGSVTTNAADVKLDGASASFAPINSLATNAATGVFEITNGRNFTTAGFFLNSGVLVVGNASTFTATASFSNPGLVVVNPGGTLLATAAPLPQYTAGTLTAGDFRVAGIFKFAGGDIVRIGGKLSLTSPAAQVQKADGSSAITGVEEVQSGGSFLLRDRTFTTADFFTNSGLVYVISSTLNVPITYSQDAGATTFLDDGTITAGTAISINGKLFGEGTLQAGLSLVSGSIHPDAGPFTAGGTIHATGELALGSNASYEWSLGTYLDNGDGVAGVDWDLVSATGRIRNSSVVDFTIGWGLDPTTGNSFWDSDHDWKVMVSETGDITPTFNLTNATFADGFFNLEKSTEGTATILTLNYTSTVPEPTGAALLACGALSVLCTRRRRTGAHRAGR